MRSPGSSNKLLAGFLVTAFGAVAFADERITLRDVCPPGFELTDSNVCELRTLYDGYDSLNDAGVGGLKTALPSARDGFSPQQIDLGRYLFFDPLLSGDNSLSCASCHHPDLAFTDGRPRAVGIGGAEVKRGAPSLWNVAFLAKFFWDARASSLEKQMQGPLYSPDEMGTPSRTARARQALVTFTRQSPRSRHH
jgi:cytochrome c peroxidase